MTEKISNARRTFAKTLAAAISLALAFPMAGAHAQDTSKPIRIIVPFAPGASNDIVGRTVAQQLSTRLKRSVIVENRAGAGGMIGSELVAHAEPDGNTLLLISSTFTMNAAIMKLNYDPVKSFTPVAMLGIGPSVIAVKASLPVNSIKELVDYSKKNPGKVYFGSAGVASFQHFAIELFRTRTGADLTIAHYKGGGPVINDLVAGHVDGSLGSLIQFLPFLKSGRIKVLGVAGPKRVDLIPDVPTLEEVGIDVDASNWWALLAPAGTPANIVEQLHRETSAVLTDPEIKKRFASQGADTMVMTRPDFEKFIASETGKWAKVAKETGIKPE